MDKQKIYIIVAIVSVIGMIVSYIIYKKKKEEDEKKLLASSTGGQGNTQELSGTGAIVFIIIFLLIFVVSIGFSIYQTMTRYSIAKMAIANGDTALGAAALSPEISSGIRSLGGLGLLGGSLF